MVESSTSKVRRIGQDIISELPREMLETIICFLPIRDAVRTSILSTKWRHCWTTIPHLIFDDQFLGNMGNNLNSCHGSVERANKFVSAINQVLLLHNGPILKFSLKVIEGCDAQTINDHISQWILLFSSIGIKKLTLDTFNSGGMTAHDFSALTLRLSRIPITTAFGEFTHLTRLRLQGLRLVDATKLNQNIFNCPVLKNLNLICCRGLSLANFDAPNLKSLREISPRVTIAKLKKLTRFSFLLYSLSWPKQTKTSNLVTVLSSLPKIEKFSIKKHFIKVIPYTLSMVSITLISHQHLTVCAFCLQHVSKYLAEGGCPKRVSKPLCYLNRLNVFDINFADLSEVSCLLCLIRSAPKLCKLRISATEDADKDNIMNYWIEDSEDCTIDHLKFVKFSNFKGLNTELKLVKFLLGHSPSLITMCIQRSRFIDQNAALTIAEMLQSSRASSRAQIRVETPP